MFALTCTWCVSALADDTGIQMIGGPVVQSAIQSQPVNMDDFKVGQTAEIDGYGDVTLKIAAIKDTIPASDNAWDTKYQSGPEAEYLAIVIEIMNKQRASFNFYHELSDIIAEFGDGYQYGGWSRECVSETYRARNNRDRSKYPIFVWYDADKTYPTDPLYTTELLICCTLPNYVINSNEPLSLSFKLGANEFTYNHR